MPTQENEFWNSPEIYPAGTDESKSAAEEKNENSLT
jgi:hypothetical protein